MLSFLDHFAFDLQMLSFQCDQMFQFDVLGLFPRSCFQGPSVEVPQLGQGNCLTPPEKDLLRQDRESR